MMGPPRIERVGRHGHGLRRPISRVACPSASGPPPADGHDLKMRARASSHGHAKRGHATQRKPHAYGQAEQHVRAGQATENHRDHRADLGPDSLCALWGKLHGPRGTAHPTVLQAPLGRHPDRRAEGPQWRDPFEQPFRKAPDAMPQHPLQWGANVDLRPLNAMTQPAVHPTSCLNNQAPNIMTQRHQRCRFATLKEQIPRLRGASLRFAPRRSE